MQKALRGHPFPVPEKYLAKGETKKISVVITRIM